MTFKVDVWILEWCWYRENCVWSSHENIVNNNKMHFHKIRQMWLCPSSGWSLHTVTYAVTWKRTLPYPTHNPTKGSHIVMVARQATPYPFLVDLRRTVSTNFESEGILSQWSHWSLIKECFLVSATILISGHQQWIITIPATQQIQVFTSYADVVHMDIFVHLHAHLYMDSLCRGSI